MRTPHRTATIAISLVLLVFCGLTGWPGPAAAENVPPPEVAAQVAPLTDAEVRSLLMERLAAEDRSAALPVADEVAQGGHGGIARFFFAARQVTLNAASRMKSLVVGGPDDGEHWRAVVDAVSGGRGLGYLLTVLFGVGAVIAGGLLVEGVARRLTGELRRTIVAGGLQATAALLARGGLRILLEILCVGVYVIVTFLLFNLFFTEGETGFTIAAICLIVSYHFRFFMMLARILLAPKAAAVRLVPLQDANAAFLYRWIVGITAAACLLAGLSLIFRETAAGEDTFLITYSLSGLSITLLGAAMIWQARRRVAEAIHGAIVRADGSISDLGATFARSWHWFAILYMLGVGFFWQVGVLVEGRGLVVRLVWSLFLFPALIGLDQWGMRLLDKVGPRAAPSREAGTDAAPEAAERNPQIAAFLPLLRRAYRILLFSFFLFSGLKLWGLDLAFGRVFTQAAFSIVVTLILAFLLWEFLKSLIDRRLREEMPESDEEMDEGGSGGSRRGTLLLLLRKFILTVLVVMVTMIVLSSLGVDIGPLIAGAGVVGLAIGFGAQTLVRDIISGVFFLIDDAFRVGDYVDTGNVKGTVEQISLRSLRLRHHRGMVHTIPFGELSVVTNFSRDYIIMKLEFRVRYDTNVDKVRKIIKKINKEISADPEMGPSLLDKIKSQGVKALDDSAMIMRVKFKTIPGEQFLIRREVFQRMQEAFRKEGIEFAHRNVTVYLPPESQAAADDPQRLRREAAAAAAQAILEEEEKNGEAEEDFSH